MEQKVIELQGKAYENFEHISARLGLSKWTIQKMLRQGLPGSIKIARLRYFDIAAVDAWLIGSE